MVDSKKRFTEFFLFCKRVRYHRFFGDGRGWGVLKFTNMSATNSFFLFFLLTPSLSAFLLYIRVCTIYMFQQNTYYFPFFVGTIFYAQVGDKK